MKHKDDPHGFATLLASEADVIVQRFRHGTRDNTVERVARALPRISRALYELEEYVVKNATKEHERVFRERAREARPEGHSAKIYKRLAHRIGRKFVLDETFPQKGLDKWTVTKNDTQDTSM